MCKKVQVLFYLIMYGLSSSDDDANVEALNALLVQFGMEDEKESFREGCTNPSHYAKTCTLVTDDRTLESSEWLHGMKLVNADGLPRWADEEQVLESKTGVLEDMETGFMAKEVLCGVHNHGPTELQVLQELEKESPK